MVGIGGGVSGEGGTEGIGKLAGLNTLGSAGSASIDYYAPAPWEGNGEDVLIASAWGFARNKQPVALAQGPPITIPAGWVSSSDGDTPGHDPQFAVGASVCACIHANLTNATNHTQLQTGFTTYSLNLGRIADIGFQLSVGKDTSRRGVCNFNFSIGFGFGASAAVYDTYTQPP